jgi:hypothetical protein
MFVSVTSSFEFSCILPGLVLRMLHGSSQVQGSFKVPCTWLVVVEVGFGELSGSGHHSPTKDGCCLTGRQ